MAAGCAFFVVDAQAIVQLSEQPTHRRASDPQTQFVQLLRNRLCGAMGPLQAGDRVAGRIGLKQVLDGRDYFRRFFSTEGLPPPG